MKFEFSALITEHHLEEIRDRTLIEILKTFNRAIENDIQLELNSILLFSSLVKYCEISPISKEDEAIDLLSKLIKVNFTFNCITQLVNSISYCLRVHFIRI